MLAMGRALMLNPKVLLLDEPLEGLAPIIVQELLHIIDRMVRSGSMAVILVEQHARQILPITRQALVLERGRVVHAGPRTTLLRDDAARGRFVAEQRSAVLRFVDTVWVEVVPRGSAASSVAILSRSNVGYYDFGVNRRRVEGLLADIAARAAR